VIANAFASSIRSVAASRRAGGDGGDTRARYASGHVGWKAADHSMTSGSAAKADAHPPRCPFCELPASRVVHRTKTAIVIRDGFPVSLGHSLILPARHIASLWEATAEEQSGLLEALSWARAAVAVEHKPGGFNIGINDGVAAGQTVMHLHVHLIPRYNGDRADPRGGIGCIFPEKSAYLSKK
jgi:diadenosine tetraphosphate (Ap4A) HIT family hydrolase